MAKTHGKQNQNRPVVDIRHITAVDSDARISRAIDMILQASMGAKSQSKGVSGKSEMPHGSARN